MNSEYSGRGQRGAGLWLIVVLVLLLGGAGYWILKPAAPEKTASQAAPGQGKPAERRSPVSVEPVKRSDVNIFLSGLGSVTPLNVVTVKSRVDGELMRINFQEGQMVKKGDLLIEIDPRPYQVQLDQALGQMARDRALLDNAKVDLKRYQELIAQDAVARQSYDTQMSLVRQYEGTVKLDQAQVDNAKLQIVYSRITSPLDGRVGLRKLDPGNMVKATDTNGLLVITQMEPISVVFSIAEDSLPQVRAKLNAGEKLPVEAFDRELKQKLADGWLTGLDNQIDSTTGTVKLKAYFPNHDLTLFPNQFVNARLRVNVLKNALSVPSPAVQRGQQGQFVYVIKADKTAEARPVELGEVTDGYSVIAKGLNEGELVVVDGADRLRVGSPVEIREASDAKGAAQGS